ncbi:hypothetical protein DFH06DRAFT_475989 [Mycena polygramma]|nr:hypothetical protein DFH06DRAFT_475989 [Mycena polygramma]
MRSLPAEILGQNFIVCRDETRDEPGYDTADPDYPPILLTHVCSRWRTVALCTPRLWNDLCLLTDNFVLGREIFVQEIFGRSCDVPLSVAIANPSGWTVTQLGDSYSESRWLDIVWGCSHRLQRISLNIYADDAGTNVMPRQTVFPQLSSPEIVIDGVLHSDIRDIMDSFGSAHLLRSLTLHVQVLFTDDAIPATFPLSQLTELDIDAPFTTVGGRDILARCTALEIAKLHGLFEWDTPDPPPPRNASTLHHLSRLDVSLGLGVGVAVLLHTLSMPNLTSLSVASQPGSEQVDQPADALLALHARSHFSLVHLSLSQQDITLPQLISLLEILPTLETLVIDQCTSITTALSEMLARDIATPTLTHTRLELLKIHPATSPEWGVVFRAAERLAACAGDASSTFPLLRSMRVHAEGRYYPTITFQADVKGTARG